MSKKKVLLISFLVLGATALLTTSVIAIPLSIIDNNKGNNNQMIQPPNKPGESDNPNKPDKPDDVDNWGNPNAPIGNTSLYNSYGKSVAANPNDKNNAILIANGGPKTSMEEGQEKVSSLEGYITNENYLNMSKRVVSLNFYDGTGPHMGTGWILDYKLADNNNYPITWYFATNAHVAYNLIVQNDYNGYNSYYKEYENVRTKELRIRSVNDPQIGSKFYGDTHINFANFKTTKVPLARLKEMDNGERDYVYDENPLVKTVFIANDFLKSDPSDYNKDPRWMNKKETADFAVIEVTFENEEDAKNATNDYANWNKDEQFKMAKSLISPETQIKEKDYYTFGYPGIKKPGYFYDAITFRINQKNTINLNDPPKHGGSLSGSSFYSSFDDVIPNSKGIYDGVLNFSWFSQPNPFTKQDFLYWGLFYTLRHDDLPPGASGSMMMNSNKETLGIQFAYDDSTDYGIIQALRSEGYNYNGKYKWYNPEPYDLVYGGFSNQKNSYKDSLYKIKDKNYRTNLFPDGNK